MIWAFDDCELDTERFQLRRRGSAVKLEPKVFDVLAFLLAQRARVVSKLELLETLWPGEALSESVLPRAIAAARRAVGDTRARAQVIETVHGRGYRFVAAVAPRLGAPAEAAPPAGAWLSAPAQARFIGRERVLRALSAALDAALAGTARVALLAGEPGIGKSRTTEQLATQARARGALVAVARCFEGEGAPALWPWRQLLRALAAAAPPAVLRQALAADAAVIAQLAPELADPSSAASASIADAGEQARFRLFDAIAGVLRRLARHAPLVLAIDDLHWADEASLLAITFLTPELRESPVLVLGTYRDVEVRRAHPLSRTLAALAREPGCERIALRGLDARDVAELAGDVVGAPLPVELAAALHDLSEGNPFFVVELARVLREGGAASSALALPQSVRDVVGRRLDAISPEANDLLRAAAVLGRSFDLALLARMVDVSREELLDALGEALDAGVLRESEARGAQYAFSHALVRQTLYEELRAPLRIHLHRRAAEALEAAAALGAEPPLSEIAHHHFEAIAAGDAEPAVRSAARAAERAHALFAYEESARLYERALEALAQAPSAEASRRFALLAAAGAEHAAAGGREAARAKFRAALAVARALGRGDLIAEAALGMRGIGEMGVPPEAETLAALEEARDGLGEGHPVLRAQLLAKLTGTPPYSLAMATRDALSAEALALARASGSPAALREALSARAWACFGPDRVEERMAVADEQVALGERTRDPLTQFHGYEGRFGTHLLRGDAAGADAALAACARLAREQPYRYVVFQARFFEAALVACRGDLVAAERLLASARSLGHATAYAELQCDAHLVWTLLQRGDAVRGPALAGELLPRIGESWLGAERVSSATRAVLALGANDGDAARRLLAEAEGPGFASLPRNEHFLLALTSATDVVHRLGDKRRAQSLYEVALPHAQLFALHDLLRTFAGSVSSMLGELCLTLGRHDEAIARYEAGIERELEARAHAAVLSSRVMLARTLRARGRRGDARRAGELLRRVASEAPALGIDWAARFGFDPESLAELPRKPL